MARGKNPEAHFNRARARGAQKDTGIVNDKPVLKGLEDSTKRNHQVFRGSLRPSEACPTTVSAEHPKTLVLALLMMEESRIYR